MSRVIGFAVYEYLGVDVYENQEDPVDIHHLVRCTRADLVDGEPLITTSIGGYVRMQVKKDGDTCSLVSGDLSAPLEFNKDERGCWVATSFINLKVVRKLRESL